MLDDEVESNSVSATPDIVHILSRGNIRRGSKIILIPSFYGHEEVGYAARELEAQLTFVDVNDRGILQEIRSKFPEFEMVVGDALTFRRDGIDATVHVRTEPQYVHKKTVFAPRHVMYGQGYEEMVRNISGWSPLHFLISRAEYYDGDLPEQVRTAIDADREVMQKYGFHLREEGLYLDGRIMRWHIFENAGHSRHAPTVNA